MISCGTVQRSFLQRAMKLERQDKFTMMMLPLRGRITSWVKANVLLGKRL
jgi:hypothetical protein